MCVLLRPIGVNWPQRRQRVEGTILPHLLLFLKRKRFNEHLCCARWRRKRKKEEEKAGATLPGCFSANTINFQTKWGASGKRRWRHFTARLTQPRGNLFVQTKAATALAWVPHISQGRTQPNSTTIKKTAKMILFVLDSQWRCRWLQCQKTAAFDLHLCINLEKQQKRKESVRKI